MLDESWNKDPEEIPKKFHSFSSGQEFDHCMICDKYLLKPGTKYMIEKAIKKYPEFNTYDVIFEFAICNDCSSKMRNALSRESLRNIETYFLSNAKREIQVINSNTPLSEIFTKKCIIKNIEEKDLNEYQMVAYCDGPNLSMGEPPILLSELAAEEMQELISEETRDELNRFSDDFLGLPPEWKEALKNEFILI